MKYLNKEIEKIENIIVNLKDVVSDLKDKINDITYKIEMYENKLSKLENINKIEEEINKEKIVRLFENLFKTSISENALADISINKNKIKIVGRPKLNNSNKQMRHIIPYSFIENMIKLQVIAKEDFKDLLNIFAENMKLFIYDSEGICLTNDEYNYLKTFNNIKYDYKLEKENNNNESIYLIEPKNESIDTIKKHIIINDKHKILYREKKQKFIKYLIKYITKEINNINTLNMISEIVARFILTLFNLKKHMSFPEEGNTLNYEIRIENDKDVKSVSHFYISKNIDYLKDNNNIIIRIVNNEGYIVKRTSKALKLLNDIIGNNYTGLFDKKLINNYNNKFNSEIYIDDFECLETFNKNITEDMFNLEYHIAKHLYFVFDYKKLEDTVFVKNIYNNYLNLNVYEGVKNNNICNYTLMDGNDYRKISILNCKNKYNKKVEFRRNILDDKEMEIISNNIINCVWIVLITYSNFIDINIDILSKFTELITMNYGLCYETFYLNYIKPKIDNISIFNQKDENSIKTQYNYNNKINDIINNFKN